MGDPCSSSLPQNCSASLSPRDTSSGCNCLSNIYHKPVYAQIICSRCLCDLAHSRLLQFPQDLLLLPRPGSSECGRPQGSHPPSWWSCPQPLPPLLCFRRRGAHSSGGRDPAGVLSGPCLSACLRGKLSVAVTCDSVLASRPGREGTSPREPWAGTCSFFIGNHFVSQQAHSS